MNKLFERVELIDFLDIGCSGALDEKWAALFPLLSYTGFDPNAEECKRLNSQPHPYKTARFLPYAIAGEEGTQTMYKTESIYCYSLIRPNHKWLNRFSYFELFKETGTDTVVCRTLNTLVREQNLKADIIKIDTQGLELPILNSGDAILSNAFCIETETGFVENYIGETTYSQIDEFMRAKGFLMFDLKIYRVGRNNGLNEVGKHQPLWVEAVWLFDFVGQEKKTTREEALKALMICKNLKYFDYGLELALYFNKLGIVDQEEVNFLQKPESWIVKPKPPRSKAGKILSLLPQSINKRLMFGLQEIFDG